MLHRFKLQEMYFIDSLIRISQKWLICIKLHVLKFQIIRVSRSLKKGQGGIQKKGTWCALSHSKRVHSVRARAMRKRQKGISNIMWKSASIFIGTGRLTVED